VAVVPGQRRRHLSRTSCTRLPCAAKRLGLLAGSKPVMAGRMPGQSAPVASRHNT
jgi:hypothetical protein